MMNILMTNPQLVISFLGSGCDGQPARAVRRLLENDTAGLYHKNTFCSIGGLHTVMKGLNSSGEYFEEI